MAGTEEQAKVKDSKVAPTPISNNTDVKKPKKSKGKMVFIIFVLLIIGGAFACYFFNFFGVKDKVVYYFITQDTQYQKIVTEQTTQKDLYEKKQQEIDAQLAELDTKKQELDAREKRITEAENATDATVQTAEANTANLQKITEMYNAMDAVKAAGILGQLTNNEWIAQILENMDAKKASSVLAAMDPIKAADITRIMIPNQ